MQRPSDTRARHPADILPELAVGSGQACGRMGPKRASRHSIGYCRRGQPADRRRGSRLTSWGLAMHDGDDAEDNCAEEEVAMGDPCDRPPEEHPLGGMNKLAPSKPQAPTRPRLKCHLPVRLALLFQPASAPRHCLHMEAGPCQSSDEDELKGNPPDRAEHHGTAGHSSILSTATMMFS